MPFLPRCVAKRVDALVLGYQITLGRELVDKLAGVQAAATAAGHAIEVDLGKLVGCSSFVVATMPRTPVGSVHLRNGDVGVMVSPDVAHGWTVEVRIFAAFLAQNDERTVLRLARRVAGFFGAWDAETGERCRRLDLASDWEGWDLSDEDDKGLVTRPRAKMSRFRPTREEITVLPESRLYQVAHEITGMAVAYGAPIMARVYDKTAELHHAGAEAKRAFEEASWRANGWNGGQITRVEFQLRGDVLYEMGFRDNVDGLFSALDGIWFYLTTKWLTLRVPGSASRLCRAKLDPRWEALQSLRWGGRVDVERVRRRGGATLAQSVGCMVSHLGGTGMMSEATSGLARPTTPEIMRMDDGAASGLLRSWVVRAVLTFALVIEGAYLCNHKTPQEAACAFLSYVQGSMARFGVVPDEYLEKEAGAG